MIKRTEECRQSGGFVDAGGHVKDRLFIARERGTERERGRSRRRRVAGTRGSRH